jgi:PPOX class probable F420-dependent enzyme
VDVDDRGVSFNTAHGRAKPNNLERDPRVGLTVVDPNDIYRWIALDGRAELTTEGADAQIDRLSEKYTGNPEYQNRVAGETRVTVRIAPERIAAHGLD